MVLSRPDYVVEGFDQLVARVRSTPARLGCVRVIAIDGPAGAGKTTFAARLVEVFRRAGVSTELVHTDDLLDGWADLTTFWPRLEAQVLAPLRCGQPGRYQRYDWAAARFVEPWVSVPVPQVLVLEGVSSARHLIRSELSLSVFVVAAYEVRVARSVVRDGARLSQQMARWRVDEGRHFAMDETSDHAELRVAGASEIRHDPQREYVRIVASQPDLRPSGSA